MKQKCLSL